MKKRLVLFSVVLLVLASGAYIFFNQRDASPLFIEDDPARSKEYWEVRINRVGPKAAYDEFVEKNTNSVSGSMHLSAHVFGELLYRKLGLNGIAVCTSQFSFGCYHGFFGRALSEEGEDVIEELDEVCIQSYGPLGTGCQHGIGHGVLEYVGYDALSRALEMCRKTTQTAPRLGCISGVFMEYNSPLVGIAENLSPAPREFDPHRPGMPCDTIAEEFRQSCYFELGSWLAFKDRSSYSAALRVCAEFEKPYKNWCVSGVGSALPNVTGYNSDDVIKICRSVQNDAELHCRAGAYWGFYSLPDRRSFAPRICAYEDEESEDLCRKYGDLTDGLDPTVQAL